MFAKKTNTFQSYRRSPGPIASTSHHEKYKVISRKSEAILPFGIIPQRYIEGHMPEGEI